jgi:hypothetical protein
MTSRRLLDMAASHGFGETQRAKGRQHNNEQIGGKAGD